MDTAPSHSLQQSINFLPRSWHSVCAKSYRIIYTIASSAEFLEIQYWRPYPQYERPLPTPRQPGHPYVSFTWSSRTPLIISPINNFSKSYNDMGSATGSLSGYTPRLQFKSTEHWPGPYPSTVQCSKFARKV